MTTAPQITRTQHGSSLMELMVGMSIGLLVLLVANNLLQVALQQQAQLNQRLEQQTASRQAHRRIQSMAISAGQYAATQTAPGAVQLHAAAPTSPNTSPVHLVLTTPPAFSPLASDCLDRHATQQGFLLSVFYVSANSLRCNVADRSGGQPIADGFKAMSVHWFVATPQGIQVRANAQPNPSNETVLGHASCLSTSNSNCNTAMGYQAVAWAPTP